MHVLSERRYMFRRRWTRTRIALAVLVSGIAVAAVTVQVTSMKPRGFLRMTSIEEPAK